MLGILFNTFRTATRTEDWRHDLMETRHRGPVSERAAKTREERRSRWSANRSGER